MPENYQRNFKIYQALPKLREAPASERETIPETPTAIVPEKGQPLMSSSPPEAQKPSESPSVAPDETSARVRAILQREEAIKKEKERMTALYSRFREFQTRSTVYRNSIKELDQETENLQKQLDALRAKQQ